MASPLESAPAPLLRRATAEDADAIRVLVDDAYGGYADLIGRTPLPMLTDYAAAVRADDVWVLMVDGSTVGVLVLMVRDDHVWLDNVAISPAAQGRGHGRRLLAHAEDEARRLELPEIRLLTNELYVENIATYTRHGYRETHREPYRGTDLVYFVKELA